MPLESNTNLQEVVRRTEVAGTDRNAKIWVLHCRCCGHFYGANSTDAWERKCPKCQRGRPGLEIPTERDGKDWTREEHVIAFNLYSQIPFGTIHMRNPKVIELAALLGRKVGSVSNKLANLSRHDPVVKAQGKTGLPHGAKGEEATVRVRVNQNFFRRRIISAYEFRCCVTGLAVPELPVASHIVPRAQDAANRLNPRNGLCLNALHDRAFDRGLMWVDDGFVVRFSGRLRRAARESETTLAWLTSFAGQPLRLPKRFAPDPLLLRQHAKHCAE